MVQLKERLHTREPCVFSDHIVFHYAYWPHCPFLCLLTTLSFPMLTDHIVLPYALLTTFSLPLYLLTTLSCPMLTDQIVLPYTLLTTLSFPMPYWPHCPSLYLTDRTDYVIFIYTLANTLLTSYPQILGKMYEDQDVFYCCACLCIYSELGCVQCLHMILRHDNIIQYTESKYSLLLSFMLILH